MRLDFKSAHLALTATPKNDVVQMSVPGQLLIQTEVTPRNFYNCF